MLNVTHLAKPTHITHSHVSGINITKIIERLCAALNLLASLRIPPIIPLRSLLTRRNYYQPIRENKNHRRRCRAVFPFIFTVLSSPTSHTSRPKSKYEKYVYCSRKLPMHNSHSHQLALLSLYVCARGKCITLIHILKIIMQ